MSDVTDIIQRGQTPPILELCEWFKSEHVNILSEKAIPKSFFERIFNIFSTKPNQISDEDWESMQLIFYIFTISCKPPSNYILIPNLSNHIDGRLTAASLVLFSMRIENKYEKSDLVDGIFNFFSDNIQYFFPKQTVPSFYSISPCFNFISVPTVICGAFFATKYNDLKEIFRRFIGITSDQLTYSIILFISDIYRTIKSALMQNVKIYVPTEFIQSFIHVLDLSIKSPSVFLTTFFPTWFFFVKQCREKLNAHSLYDKIPTIAMLFEKTAIKKYHELHLNFPWYLFFFFYGFVPQEEHFSKEKLLLFACNGIRTVSRLDSYNGIHESIKDFSISIENQYLNHHPYELFYILESLDSSMKSIFYQLDKIHSFGKIIRNTFSIEEVNSSNFQGKLKKKQFFFYEQGGFSPNAPNIDKFLFSYIFEKMYYSIDECLNDYEYMMKICNKIKSKFHSIILFQLQFSSHIKEIISKDPQMKENLSLVYYLINMFSTVFQLMVYISFKQTELLSFNKFEIENENAYKHFRKHENIVSHYYFSTSQKNYKQNQKKYSLQKLLDYEIIQRFKQFFGIVNEYPKEFIETLALRIAYNLFSYIEQGIVSFHFIQLLYNINMKIHNPKSLMSITIIRMMEIASSKINYLMLADIKLANLFFQWIGIIIRISSLPNGNQNIWFGELLKTYKRLFIVSVFANMKSISHQSIAVRTIKFFLEAIKKNTNEDTSNKSKSGRIRPLALEELEITASIDTLNVVLDIIIDDHDFMTEYSILPFIESAFKTKDIEVVNKAAKVCLTIFTPERSTSKFVTPRPDLENIIFQEFVNSICFVSIDIAKEITKIIPYYYSKFLQNSSSIVSKSIFSFKSISLDIYNLLLHISEKLDNSEEEASHLFALVTVGFNFIISEIIQLQENVQQTLSVLIILLRLLNGFESLKSQLERLIGYISYKFGDLFLNCESNTYILSVFDVIGINRSESTASTMKLAISFFEYIAENKNELNNSQFPNFIGKTINDLFSFFSLQTRLFSILTAFSLFIRYYPSSITLNHIRCFLIQTHELYPFDNSFSKILNLFLKKYLETCDMQTKQRFVAMIYEIICPLSINVRIVLEKRLEKLSIPLEINSLDEIAKTNDSNLMFQQLTLAILCGIKGDLINSLNSEWINRTKKFFAPQQNESIHRIQKLSRILSLCLAILKNREVFSIFLNDNDLSNITIKYLCNSLMSHFSPVQNIAKKCFKVLKSLYFEELLSMKHIDDFLKNPSKIFKFWDHQPERIAFYTNLTRILPQKVPSEITLSFFNELNIYVNEKSDSEKMKHITNLTKILNHLAVKKYWTPEKLQSFVNHTNPNGQLYLEMYIDNILALYNNSTIPFKSITKKPVFKFFALFPKQTLNYLINCNNPTLCNFVLITDLIIDEDNIFHKPGENTILSNSNNGGIQDNSKTNIFFQALIEYFSTSQSMDKLNIKVLSPAFFQIFETITLYEKFASDPLLLTILFKELNKFANKINDHEKRDENCYPIISSLSKSLINIMRFKFELKNIIKISSIFRIPFLARSDIYYKYKSLVFNESTKPEILKDILKGTFKSFQKLSPCMTFILLPNCIKTLKQIEEPLSNEIWSQLTNNLHPTPYLSTFLKSVLYMLDKAEPTKEHLFKILESMKNNLASCDPQEVIYSLKVCKKLGTKNQIPKEFFEASLQQFFLFPKFFDIPYSESVFQFLYSCHDYITTLSPHAIQTISFFFYDKFSLSLREIEKHITPLLNIPQIFKLLPFSFFSSFLSCILKKIKSMRKPHDELGEIRDALFFSSTIYDVLIKNEIKDKTTYKKQINMFFTTGFKFFKNILKSHSPIQQTTNSSKDFTVSFFEIMTEAKDFINEKNKEKTLKFINQLNGTTMNSTVFFLVCFASTVIPTEFLYNHHLDLIEQTFCFIENDNNIIAEPLLLSFIEYVIHCISKHTENSNNLSIAIDKLLTTHIKRLSIPIFNRVTVIITTLIKELKNCNFSRLIFSLWDVYANLNKTIRIARMLFEYLIQILILLPPSFQIEYIERYINLDNWDSSTTKIYISILPTIFSSRTVSNSAKVKLFDTLYQIYEIASASILYKIIKSIIECSLEIKCNVTGIIIMLYIFIVSKSNSGERFTCIEKINELINTSLNSNFPLYEQYEQCTPFNHKFDLNIRYSIGFQQKTPNSIYNNSIFLKKFAFLKHVLPRFMWKNSFFIYIIALLLEKSEHYYSIIAFADRIKSVASALAIPLFADHLSLELQNELLLFLMDLVKVESMAEYSQVLIAIESVIISTSNRFPFDLLVKLSNLSPESILFCNSQSLFNFSGFQKYKNINPDILQDAMIDELFPHASERFYAAISMTYLSRYEAAEKIYLTRTNFNDKHISNEINQNKLSSRDKLFNSIKQINAQCIIDDETNINDILSPLLKVNNKNDDSLLYLKKAFKSFIKHKNNEKIIEYINKSKCSSLNYIRRYTYQPIAHKERFFAINIMGSMIENRIFKETTSKLSHIKHNFESHNFLINSQDLKGINPSIAKAIICFERLLDNLSPQAKIEINSSDHPVIILSPSAYSDLHEVTGITQNGMLTLSANQISNIFQKYENMPPLSNNEAENLQDLTHSKSNSNQNNSYSADQYIKFVHFCFNVFIIQPSQDMFSLAYGGYSQVLASKSKSLSSISKSLASARIITLIRSSIAQQNSNFINTIIQHKMIFKRNFAEFWRIWLQQLISVANNNWFFNIANELFSEMSYRSTLYSSKYCSKDVQDTIKNLAINDRNFVQISMMNKIEAIVNTFMGSVKFDEIERQENIITFLEQSLRLSESELDQINDLLSLRLENTRITPFDFALSKLTRADIDNIGDFRQWISCMKNLTKEEREIAIMDFTHSSAPYSVLFKQMTDIIHEFNNQMPFIFPLYIDENNIEFSLFLMHQRVFNWSPEIKMFTATTSFSSKQYFLLMRSNREKGFHASVISISNLFSLMRNILKDCYQTIVRSITLSENLTFEIGSSLMIKGIYSEPISLKQVFEEELMLTQEEWINKYIDKTTGSLNQAGEENIKTFDPNRPFRQVKCLLHYDDSKVSLQSGIITSYASSSVVRYTLSAPYHNMDKIIVCENSIDIPILSIDFDTGNFVNETPWSNFRFSPIIERFCGLWRNNGIKMSIAAVATAFTESIEMIRTHIEILLGDDISIENFDFQELIRQRTIVENRFISLSPPSNALGNDEECTQWYTNINLLIEKAKNPWIQPANAIPWY